MKISFALLFITLLIGCQEDISTKENTPIISGTAPDSVVVNSNYIFKPKVSVKDNDTVTFLIKNRPEWLEFNKTTGELRGTPTLEDINEYKNITISVSDGVKTRKLDPFTLIVKANKKNELPTEFISSKEGNIVREKVILDLKGLESLNFNIINPVYEPLPTNEELLNQDSNVSSHALELYPNGYIDANNITIKRENGKSYLYNLSYSKIDSIFVQITEANGSHSIKKLRFNKIVEPQTIYEIDNLNTKNMKVINSDELFNSKVRFFNKKEKECSLNHSCTGSETVQRKTTLGERAVFLAFYSNIHYLYNSVDIMPIFDAWAYNGAYDQNRDGDNEIDFFDFKKPCSNFDECKIDTNNIVPTAHDFLKVIDRDTQKSYLYRSLFRASSPSNRINLKILEYKNTGALGVGGTSRPTSNFGDKLTLSSGLALKKGMLVDFVSKYKDILQDDSSDKYDKKGNLLSNPLNDKDYKKYKKTNEYKKRYQEYKDNYNISSEDEINPAIYDVAHHELMHSFGFGHASGMTYGFSTALKQAVTTYLPYQNLQVVTLPNLYFNINATLNNDLSIDIFNANSKNMLLANEVTVEIFSPNSIKVDFYKKDNKIILHFNELPVNRFFLRIYDNNSHQVMSKLIYPLDFKSNQYISNGKKYFLVEYNQWKNIVSKPANYARMLGNNGSLKPERALLSYEMKVKDATSICRGWSGDLDAKTVNVNDIPILYNSYLKDNIDSKKFFTRNRLYDLTTYKYKDGDTSKQLETPISYDRSDELRTDTQMEEAYILCESSN